MLEILFQLLFLSVCILLGFVLSFFIKSRWRSIIGIMLGIIVGFSALYDYSLGKNFFLSLIKYSILSLIGVLLLEFGRRVAPTPEQLGRYMEVLEGRITAVINCLKEKGIITGGERDEAELKKIGESYELVKEDEFFRYYKVRGKEGSFLVRIDKQTGYLAGIEKVSVFKGIFRMVRLVVPVGIFLFLLVTAYKGYQQRGIIEERFSSALLEKILKLPFIKKIGIVPAIEGGKNCSYPFMEVLQAIALNKTTMRPINLTHLEVIYKGKNFILEIKTEDTKPKEICLYENGKKCGCMSGLENLPWPYT